MQGQARFDPDEQPPPAHDSSRPEREDRLVQTLSGLVRDFVVRADDRRTLRVPPLDEYWQVAPGYNEPRSRGHARMRAQAQLFMDELRLGLDSADLLDTWVAHQVLLALSDYILDDPDGPVFNRVGVVNRLGRPVASPAGRDSGEAAQAHRRIRDALAEIDAGLSGSGRVEVAMVRRVHEAIGEFLACYDKPGEAS